MTVAHVLATILLIGGVGVEVIAVVGLTAMRDALDRLHYVALAGFGALLVAIAILVRASFSLLGDKALAIGILLVLLSPVLVHTTARSLRTRRYGDWRHGIEERREEDKR